MEYSEKKILNFFTIAICERNIQRDILNKLLDYISIELAFEKVFYRHGGLEVWVVGTWIFITLG